MEEVKEVVQLSQKDAVFQAFQEAVNAKGVCRAEGEPYKHDTIDVDSTTDNGYYEREVGFKGIDAAGEITVNFNEKNNLKTGVDFIKDKHKFQTFFNSITNGANPGSPLIGKEIFDKLKILVLIYK